MRKYLEKSENTALGHMKLVQQGVCSTSKGETTHEQDEEAIETQRNKLTKGGPPTDELKTAQNTGRERRVVACSIPLKDMKGIVGTDQTGRLPIASQQGHKHIFVLCDINL